MHGCLQQVLGQDNDARKQAENNLNSLKQSNADKYAIYLIEIIKSSKYDLISLTQTDIKT